MATEATIRLHELPLGARGQVERLHLKGVERRRLLDLGLVPGTLVEARLESPLGDPIAYKIRGSVVAIRRAQAEQIEVTLCKN